MSLKFRIVRYWIIHVLNKYVIVFLGFSDPLPPRHQTKGQTKLKWFFQADVSSKKRTKEFDFPTMRLVFVCILEEINDTKKTF